jgi:uncharacterized membrane protein (TIGR02234 family)
MAETAAGSRGRSRSFGPTVPAGLAAGALTAVAATRDWATASAAAAGGGHVAATAQGSASAPLAVALALVALAAWGVVLVLRGRARQAVAVAGALASAGVLAAVLSARQVARHDAVGALLTKGGTAPVSASLTAWYVVCGIAAAVTLVSFVVAVVASPRWPAMGSRYDAPSRRPPAAAVTGATAGTTAATEQELWRALDDGDDPTA